MRTFIDAFDFREGSELRDRWLRHGFDTPVRRNDWWSERLGKPFSSSTIMRSAQTGRTELDDFDEGRQAILDKCPGFDPDDLARAHSGLVQGPGCRFDQHAQLDTGGLGSANGSRSSAGAARRITSTSSSSPCSSGSTGSTTAAPLEPIGRIRPAEHEALYYRQNLAADRLAVSPGAGQPPEIPVRFTGSAYNCPLNSPVSASANSHL